MWTYEHSVDTQADAAAVFSMFSDVPNWPEWNAGVERVDLDGPFVAGTPGSMVVPGQEPMAFRLIWVEEGWGFEDETAVPDVGVVVRVRHSLEPLDGGRTRITYRCVIDGPSADTVGPDLGPMITGDFPEVMGALAARAARQTATR
jgi:hypothetical protein